MAGGMDSLEWVMASGPFSPSVYTTLTLPAQRISERVLGPTLSPEDVVTPASPWLGAARAESTNTSAITTARPDSPCSELPVRESVAMAVKASASN